MNNRENDIQKLCKSVKEIPPIFWDNPNGGYEFECPFCSALVVVGGGRDEPTMETLKHDSECAYLIAKDLSTGHE